MADITPSDITPWPICSVCGTRVQSYEFERVHMDKAYVWRFYCHGDKDEVRIDHIALLKMHRDIYRDLWRFLRPFENRPRQLTSGGGNG